MGSQTIGATVTETVTSAAYATSGRAFGLGDRFVAQDGKEYAYVQASGAITAAGYVVIIDEDHQAVMATTTNSATARGDRAGVAACAFADDDYGWVQVYGACVVRTAASCAANIQINTTATAGQLDDDATASSEVVERCFLTAATGGAAATSAAMLNYPSIGATL